LKNILLQSKISKFDTVLQETGINQVYLDAGELVKSFDAINKQRFAYAHKALSEILERI